jgi:hypothetical protein
VASGTGNRNRNRNKRKEKKEKTVQEQGKGGVVGCLSRAFEVSREFTHRKSKVEVGPRAMLRAVCRFWGYILLLFIF